MTSEQKENRKASGRKYYADNKDKFVERRRKYYDDSNMDLFYEQKVRAASAFERFETHPTFDRCEIDKARDKIADIIGKDSRNDVEDTEVWGVEQLFNPYGQTRYAVDEKTGVVDETHVLEVGKSDYLDKLMMANREQLGKIEMRTCSNCCERWFHFRRAKRDTSDTVPCYIEELPKWRVEKNDYEPTANERAELLDKWYKLYPEASKPPSDRVLMIANLVRLNRKSEYTCLQCKHGTTSRFKKHKMCATKRQRVYSVFNFAIPPLGPLAQLKLTDEEEYIISRCIVAMRIENR